MSSPSPKDIRMCATCTLFEPPKSCKVVEGEISPNGGARHSRLQTDLNKAAKTPRFRRPKACSQANTE